MPSSFPFLQVGHEMLTLDFLLGAQGFLGRRVGDQRPIFFGQRYGD